MSFGSSTRSTTRTLVIYFYPFLSVYVVISPLLAVHLHYAYRLLGWRRTVARLSYCCFDSCSSTSFPYCRLSLFPHTSKINNAPTTDTNRPSGQTSFPDGPHEQCRLLLYCTLPCSFAKNIGKCKCTNVGTSRFGITSSFTDSMMSIPKQRQSHFSCQQSG